MIDKLVTLTGRQDKSGVYKHKFGDELISKGMKFNVRNISENLFPANNPYRDESQYAVPEEVNLIGDVLTDSWTGGQQCKRSGFIGVEKLPECPQ